VPIAIPAAVAAAAAPPAAGNNTNNSNNNNKDAKQQQQQQQQQAEAAPVDEAAAAAAAAAAASALAAALHAAASAASSGLFRPKLSPAEVSDSLLSVEPHELKHVPVWVSAAEREKKLEAEQAEKGKGHEKEEQARRALDDMVCAELAVLCLPQSLLSHLSPTLCALRRAVAQMYGTIESKKDLNRLTAELTAPAVTTTKRPEDMTDEEKQAVAHFERDRKILLQERETRQRNLGRCCVWLGFGLDVCVFSTLLFCVAETELKRLKNEVNDLSKAFDKKLQDLFQHRLELCRALYREEWSQLQLTCSVLDEEQSDTVEGLLGTCLDSLKEEKARRVRMQDNFELKV
jgi:hypothetical protein